MDMEARYLQSAVRITNRVRAALRDRNPQLALQKLAELERLDIALHRSKGVRLLQVRALRASGQIEAAEQACNLALQAFPDDLRLLSQSAHNATAMKDRGLAVSRLEKLLSASGEEASEKTYQRLIEALKLAARHGEADARAAQGVAHFPESSLLRSLCKKPQPFWALDLPAWQQRRSQSPVNREPQDWQQALDLPTARRHPYQKLQPRMFWNRAVENTFALDITDWYRKKFSIAGMAVATAGSCFAQHIGNQLRQNGYNFVDVEPAPSFLKVQSRLEFGYGMYSARFGNIYSSRQLLQLVQRALGEFEPQEQAWAKQGGFVDPFRPTIEPEPFESVEELQAHRCHHLQAVEKMFRLCNVFVFTFGLTEAWESIADGAIFPLAPGVSGGSWNPKRYRLKNLDASEVMSDMEHFITKVRTLNPTLKFIFTVSPVPLMATATDDHVVVATSYSKSVLRAVAGQLAAKYDFVDYFPSYEIISAAVMRGQFYNPDMRSVSSHGVRHVMRQFFSQHLAVPDEAKATETIEEADEDQDVACDEELLRAFGKTTT